MKKWISLLLAGILTLTAGCGSGQEPASDLTPVTLNEVAHSIDRKSTRLNSSHIH